MISLSDRKEEIKETVLSVRKKYRALSHYEQALEHEHYKALIECEGIDSFLLFCPDAVLDTVLNKGDISQFMV